MNINDGGTAFPCNAQLAPPGYAANENRPASSGMSLRDHFAGEVLNALIIHSIEYSMSPSIDAAKYSQRAYQFADAMLEERKK